MSSIYRKAALERLSSPEQLDHLVEVTSPRDWIALGALGLVIFAALIWAIFGRIPTTVTGSGILVNSAGIFEVEVLGTGVVEDLAVDVGDLVRAGQLVARVRQPELEQRIRQVEDRIAALGDERNQRQLREAEQEVEALRQRLEQTSQVASPYEGTVREIRADEGQIVTAGSALIGLDRVGGPLHAVVFIATEGQRIQPEMNAQVTPVTVKREEFGFMLGTVTFVSRQPATPEGMLRVLRDPGLAEQLLGQAALFMVEVELEADTETVSGFHWSSPAGPPLRVESGTPCEVRVVVSEQRPISLVIPLVRRRLGLSA